MAVFVSYNHDDSRYAKELDEELRFLNASTGIVLWDDSQIPPGTNWRDEIKVKLQSAEAAILLISNRYLGSKFCLYEAKLLAKVLPDRVCPLLVSEADLATHPEIAQIQVVPWSSRRNLVPLDQCFRSPFPGQHHSSVTPVSLATAAMERDHGHT